MRKIGIIGAGNVGSHVGFALASQGVANHIYFVDAIASKAQGEADDLNDAASFLPHKVRAFATTADQLGDCHIIVIAAGPLPEANQDRLDTLDATLDVLEDILPALKRSGFSGLIISISNPADVIAAYIQKALNYDKRKIFSTGTLLDTMRLQHMLSETLQLYNLHMNALVLGEHGNSSLIPWSLISVYGKTLTQLQADQPHRFPIFDRLEMLSAVRERGSVVQRNKSCTEFGISTCTAEIIRAYFNDEKKVLPLSCALDGAYNEHDVFASVPVILGKDGIEEIIEIPMNSDEQEAFQNSCHIIRTYIHKAYKRL